LRAGDFVAADPSGKSVVVELMENPVARLIQVPLDGAPERELRHTGDLRPAFMISPNSVGRDGRILTSLGTSTWNWPLGIFDPSSGTLTQIATDYISDMHGMNWSPDGKVIALGLGMRTKLWKFK
jgi:hypothetical protein